MSRSHSRNRVPRSQRRRRASPARGVSGSPANSPRVERLQRFELVVPRPGWLTAGAVKLGLLSLFVVLVAMLRPRLTPGNAGWVTLAGAFAAVVGAACFLVVTRRIALQLPLPARSGAGEAATFAPGRLRRAYAAGRTERVTDAVFVVLRRMGLPLLGLAFFLVWT